MDMMAEPHRPVGSSVSEAGLPGWSRGQEKFGPSISLRLGIGPDDDSGLRVKAEEHFKHAQLDERYNLFLPRRDLMKHHSTSVGFSHGAISYGDRMSLEVERCRRTDGKKWRCRKAVIHGKKYCELHINRGCGRSRKPVEVSDIVSPTETRDLTEVLSQSNEMTVLKHSDGNLGLSKADIGVIHRVGGGVSLESTSRNESTSNKKPVAVWKVTSPLNLKADIPVGVPLGAGISPEWSSKKNNTFGLNDCETSVSVVKSSSSYKATVNNTGKCEDRYCFDHRPDVPKIRIGINSGIKSDGLPGFGSSAKSLIPGRTDSSKIEETDQDQWRCRRTDGKKWRCYRDVHPNQKYCLQHMHRGSKKPQLSSPLLGSVTSRCPTLMTSKTAQTSDPANINTSLTISSSVEDRKSCTARATM